MANILVEIGIFMNLFFVGHAIIKEPFELYVSYIPIILLLPIFILKFKFDVKNLYILIPLILAGTINVFLDNDTFRNFFKIFINIAINLLFYDYVLQYYNYDVKLVIKKYLNISFYVCCFGLIQLVSFWIGFPYGYDLQRYVFLNKWGVSYGGLGIRINSTFSEPAYVGTSLGPAFFFAAYSIVRNDNTYLTLNRSLVIIACYVLSFSSLAFTGVFITILLITINFGAIRYLIISIPLAFLLFYIGYNNAPEFKSRIDGLNALFVKGVLDEYSEGNFTTKLGAIDRTKKILKEAHGSSFILYNNYFVAKTNFKKNIFLGTGLGSHELAFKKYNLNYLLGGIYEFNTKDANSMFLRIMSVLGLMGLIFTFYFLYKFYVARDLNNKEPNEFWLISNSLLVIMLIQLIRQGNYTFNGFFIYGWMYYYNYKNYLDYLSEPETKENELTKEAVNPA